MDNNQLTAERDALRDRVQDYEDTYRRVLSEECSPDEQHCTCVPTLRAEIKRLQAERQWIPLDNANPPADGLYLTYGFWHETIVGHCIRGKWNVQGVTHYMPLPKPPAGQP